MPEAPYLPDNTRVYAIGDIHGGLSLLENLMDVIVAHEQISPPKETVYLIFLGDYVDRGHFSKQVIDYFLNQIPDQFEAVFLKGNHEEMMLDALDTESINGYRTFQHWYYNGGQNTLLSYGIPDNHDYGYLQDCLIEKLNATHLDFFKDLQVKFEIGQYFFCHAGIRPGVPLQHQDKNELLWIRNLFLNSQARHEKIIVHGHTPEIVEHHGNRIGIDAGSVMTGKLTAVCLEQDGSHQFLTVTGETEWPN